MTPDEEGARERSRAPVERAQFLTAAFVAVAVAALAVVIISFTVDVVPDHVTDATGFFGWRLVFLVLSVALISFVIERETAYRRAQRRLLEHERMNEHLTEIDRLRGDLVATVTHELKTPLMSLLGYAQILRKRASMLSEDQRVEYIGVMEEQAARILRLIEELLQSSRLERGAGLQRAPLDLAGLARRVANELSVGRGRAIEVRAPEADLGLFGDPSAVEHILSNLLENALKYSDGPVVVRVEEGDGEVLLSVEDDGVGIAADELPHIFERFQQATNARGRSSVGLGLYIVRNLVRAHGGRVWAESEVGKGSRFIVALPRRRAAARESARA